MDILKTSPVQNKTDTKKGVYRGQGTPNNTPQKTTTLKPTSSQKTTSFGPASGQYVFVKPTTISTADGYNRWDLKIEGNELWLSIKGKPRQLVKIAPRPELEGIIALFKPIGKMAYQTKQWQGKNCGMLANLQEMMLTGHHLDDLINAVDYDPKNKAYSMTYRDQKGQHQTYKFTVKELLRFAKEDNAIAFSPTHPILNALVDRSLRRAVYADTKQGKTPQGNTPDDPNNLRGSSGLLPKYLNSGVRKSSKELTVIQGKVVKTSDPSAKSRPYESFTLKQLAALRQANPNITMTVSIRTVKKDKNGEFLKNEIITVKKGKDGKLLKTRSYQWVLDMEAEKRLREKGLYKKGLLSQHAYTVLAVNLAKQTVTVVNPYDSSKAMVLDASSLMFNFLLLAKAPTTEERFATAPSKAETA